MKSRGMIFFMILVFSLLLSACGRLEINIQQFDISTPTPFPTPIQVINTPFSIATPTQPVPTLEPTPAPTNTAGIDLHLKAGVALKLLRTKMNSETNGWAIATVDGDLRQHILFTSNGGVSWTDRTPVQRLAASPSVTVTAVASFASDTSAWAIFSDQSLQPGAAPLVVWHTDDNGVSWQPGDPLDMTTVNEEFEIPSDLGFLDDQHGWIMIHVGAGMMHDYFAAFTTANGGQTWTRFIDPSTQTPIMSCEKSGLAFTSPSTGWITGNCPGLMPQLFIFHTIDSGANWASVILPAPDGKPAGYFGQSSIACGIPAQDYTASRTLLLTLTCQNLNNNTAQAWLYASSDDGATWSQHPLPLPFGKLSMLGLREGFLVGSLTTDPAANGAVYHSADGGATWSMLTSTAWIGLPEFVDDHTGWVIATHNDQTAYVHTLDGGRTWVEIIPVTGE